jgi:hypothetical protein
MVDGIDGHGCPPMSPIASGLVHMELNRATAPSPTWSWCRPATSPTGR